MTPCECAVKVCSSLYDGTSDATNAMENYLSENDGYCLISESSGISPDDVRQCYTMETVNGESFATPTIQDDKHEECQADSDCTNSGDICAPAWFGYSSSSSSFIDTTKPCGSDADCSPNSCVSEQDWLRLWQRSACGGLFTGALARASLMC